MIRLDKHNISKEVYHVNIGKKLNTSLLLLFKIKSSFQPKELFDFIFSKLCSEDSNFLSIFVIVLLRLLLWYY